MALLQNSDRLAVLYQEAEYRESFSQGGPFDEAEFRRFLVREECERVDGALHAWCCLRPPGGL